ncbi:LysR substrate-binding domain-containing protein [Actinoplanes sp. CA-131856]
MTQAAIALHMSQPALSHQISSLEKEIGASLVERRARGVRLTPAGQAVAQEARSALHHASLAVSLGRRVGRGQLGRLRIACAETMTNWLLTPTMRQWRLKHPEVHFELSEFVSADAMDRFLSAGDADLIVGPRPTATNHHVELLGREEMVVVAAAGHHFADEAAISLAEVAKEPFIHYVAENGLSVWADELAADNGITFEPVLRTRSPRTAAGMAAANIGVTLVPVSALAGRNEGTIRPLRPRYLRDIIVTVASPADELSKRFVADLRARGLPDDARALPWG